MSGAVKEKEININIFSDPKHLAGVRARLSKLVECAGFEKVRANEVILAVDEALTNIIKHSYDGAKDKEIIIQATLFSDKLEITLRDFGKKVEKEKIVSRPLEHIRPGGLGVYFINEIMDEVEYDISPKLGTILRLVKYRHKQSKDRGGR